MKNLRLSNRYAQALFGLALEMKLLDKVVEDMKQVYTVSKDNRELRLIMQSPVINPDKKEKIIKALFEKEFQQISIHFLLIIIRKRRETAIMDIAEMFIEIFKEYKNITTTELTTAVPLDASLRKELLALLEKQTGGEIDLIEEIKEEIVGGFVLNFDNRQYDASVAKQLKNLKKEFSKNLFIKGF